jgi:hypothetical protein
MQLSKEAVEEFKRIYKVEFGEEISDREATEKAIRLINLMRVIYRKIPEDQENKYPSS